VTSTIDIFLECDVYIRVNFEKIYTSTLHFSLLIFNFPYIMPYTVRFVNPQKHYQRYRKEYLAILDDVLARGDYIMRKDLEMFERRIARLVGTRYAVGLNSGTDALSFSFAAMGLKPQDEVITVAHTFMASISAIAHHGATPVLIDVGKDFTIDAAQIKQAITKKTKAIEVVHLNGRLSDMEAVMAIARKHKLYVVEDAAQALGAKMKMKNGSWKMAGSFGVTGCFSMYPFKSLGCFGDGGIVTTDDAEVAHTIQLLRYNGEDRKTRKFYLHGHTALLDNIQAAILNVKLPHFPKWIARRQAIANLYQKGLAEVSQVVVPHFEDPRFFDTYQNYVIRAKKRDKLVAFLSKKGVETLISWETPNYKQPLLQPNSLVLPETETICKEVVSLPMYPELEDEDVNYVTNAIREFYR